jgi:RecB family exonuclease
MPLEHLPVTALQCFRDCPRRFYLRYVLGLAEKPGEGDWLHGLSAPRRGDVAHRVLEIVGRGGLSDGSVEEALNEAIGSGALATRITSGEREKIARTARWFIEEARLDDGAPIYEQWLAGAARLRAEAEFVAPLAGTRIEGKIDALAEDADGAWRVLDYKTGKPGGDKRGAYRFQLGLYCAAVEAITGRMPVDAAVVLLEAGEILRLDPPAAVADALAEARVAIEAIREGAFARHGDCPARHCGLAYACQLA